MKKTDVYAKRVWAITTMYFDKCTNEKYKVGKKYTADFWKVRAFFYNKGPSSVDKIYNYLWSIEGKKSMNMTTVFNNANKMNLERQVKKVEEKGGNQLVDWYSKLIKL